MGDFFGEGSPVVEARHDVAFVNGSIVLVDELLDGGEGGGGGRGGGGGGRGGGGKRKEIIPAGTLSAADLIKENGKVPKSKLPSTC